MNKTALTALFVAVGFAAAGCGGSGSAKPVAQQPRQADAKTADTAGAAQLNAAVRRALRGNYRLSLYTLWYNRLPRWATESTRGPALAGLRSSAAGRRKRGIQIRVLDRQWAIVSIRLDPSYMRANAIVQSHQHVRPYGRDGKPLGHAIVLDEHASIALRRLGNTRHFVVWRVVLLK